jgi:hypothetical protein
MLSKIKVTVISIVLAALAFGGFSVALAASSPSSTGALAAPALPAAANAAALASATPAPATAAPTTALGTTWAMGLITAVASDNFTLQGPLGGVHVVYVNDQTQYFNRDAQASRFAALQVGDRVLGAATVADSKATAKLVIDLGARTDYRGIGVASAVNSAEQSFTFVNRRGVVWEFYTDANTKITDKQGSAKTFADIQPGARMFVHAEKRADGKWWPVDIKLGKTVPPAASAQS